MEYETYELFTKNKYYRWYDAIIKKAVSENRTYDSSYHEYHHALPDCLGGKELVVLTFKEHYICHWLLTKFSIGEAHYKMIVAMTFFYYLKINKSAKRPLNAQKSIAYSNFKTEFAKITRDRYAIPENNPNFNPEKFLFRNIKSNKVFSYNRTEAYENTQMTQQDVYRLTHRGAKTHKSTSVKGWDIYVEDLGLFSSNIQKEKNKTQFKKMVCEHCNSTVNLGNYHRWHGNNCKLKH
jgi:hypothetical protein